MDKHGACMRVFQIHKFCLIFQTGVANTKESITTKTEWIGTQTPIFEQLEVDFDQKGVDYEQKKKDIVGMFIKGNSGESFRVTMQKLQVYQATPKENVGPCNCHFSCFGNPSFFFGLCKKLSI